MTHLLATLVQEVPRRVQAQFVDQAFEQDRGGLRAFHCFWEQLVYPVTVLGTLDGRALRPGVPSAPPPAP